MAFKTNRNNPKLNRVTGNVNNTNNGFKNVFKNPKTIANTKADSIDSTLIPGKKLDNTNTANADNIILTTNRIFTN